MQKELMERRVAKKNSCDGKIKHHSPAAAQKQLDRLKENKERLNIYPCLWCSGWHVGNLIKD